MQTAAAKPADPTGFQIAYPAELDIQVQDSEVLAGRCEKT